MCWWWWWWLGGGAGSLYSLSLHLSLHQLCLYLHMLLGHTCRRTHACGETWNVKCASTQQQQHWCGTLDMRWVKCLHISHCWAKLTTAHSCHNIVPFSFFSTQFISPFSYVFYKKKSWNFVDTLQLPTTELVQPAKDSSCVLSYQACYFFDTVMTGVRSNLALLWEFP